MKGRAEVISELRTMLADVFAAKASGETYGRLARAHGYVDGYMRALIELGVMTKDELVEIVSSERERSHADEVTDTAEVDGDGDVPMAEVAA
jgi:hypothetical protein